MKAGFTVENDIIFKNDDCILVDNVEIGNFILNIPMRANQLDRLKDQHSIGVWKIKSLKN